MSTIVFTPASIEAFKRASRDLQSTCGNPLQDCQEALARAYGYADFHALQEHLSTSKKRGPFPDETRDLGERMRLSMRVQSLVLTHLKPLRLGRIRASDLGLTERPDVRAAIMAMHRATDDLLEGKADPELGTGTSEYFFFEQAEDLKEGVLRRTEKGEVVAAALQHLIELEEGAKYLPGAEAVQAELDRIFSVRRHIVQTHPNSPHALAALLTAVFASWGDDLPEATANSLWPEFRRCREMFELVVPKGFRRSIEPKLVGNGADNFPYIHVLWCGAMCAQRLGLNAAALAWARKGRTLNRNDNFGFRYIVDALK